MPKDPTKNVDRYKIRGGDLNEFEFTQNQAAFEMEQAEPTNLIPGTPPEARPQPAKTGGTKKARKLAGGKKSAKRTTTNKAAAKKATAKKSTAKKATKKSSAKKSAAKKSSKRRRGSKK